MTSPRLQSRPAVLWFTGPSAAGKSTLADALCAQLESVGLPCERLDGDTIRKLAPQTGFDRASREAHIRKVGAMAAKLEQGGATVIASFISPDRSTRDFVRSQCGHFLEIYVSTPIEVCRQRDPKGLYKRAARGEISNMVGMDVRYEEPLTPDLRIDTTQLSVESAIALILAKLEEVVPKIPRKAG